MNTAEDEEYKKRIEEYKNRLYENSQESQSKFDKVILFLSSGALTVSLLILKDVIGSSKVLSLELLKISWIVFTVSLVSVLLSHLSSTTASYRALLEEDLVETKLILPYCEEECGKFSFRELFKFDSNKFNKITLILNRCGLILFLVGICCITMFASVNISERGSLNEKKRDIKATCQPIEQSYSNPTTNR